MKVDELNEARVFTADEYEALIKRYKKESPDKYEEKKEVLKQRLDALKPKKTK